MKESTQRTVAGVRFVESMLGYRRDALRVARARARGEFNDAQSQAVTLAAAITSAMGAAADLPGMDVKPGDVELLGILVRARILADALE